MARKHDESYKLVFSQRAAVEELVRNFVGGDLADALDFETLEPLPTERIGGGLDQRRMDLLWKIRLRTVGSTCSSSSSSSRRATTSWPSEF